MDLTLEQMRFIDEIIDLYPVEFLLRFSMYVTDILKIYGEDDFQVQHFIQKLETQTFTDNELVQIAIIINSSYPSPLRLKYVPVQNTFRISHRLLQILHYEMNNLLEIVTEIKNEIVVRYLIVREARTNVSNRFIDLARLGLITGMEDIRKQLDE